MRLDDQNPVFRKVIIPWYDSEAACIFMIVFLFFVFCFGITGISVAREFPGYNGYAWVPALLMVSSAGVIVSIFIRLIKRFAYRQPDI